MTIKERKPRPVPLEKDVHVISRGSAGYAVYQEGATLIPDLTWDRAIKLARTLGGKIVVHESREAAVADARLRKIAASL